MANMIVLHDVYHDDQVTLLPCFIVKKERVTSGEALQMGAKTVIYYRQNNHSVEFYVKESIEEINRLCTG